MESEDYLVDGPENKAATIDDLKKVIKLLQKYDVPHILIGGYAMMLQGNQRITKDIDIILPIGLETGKKVKEALQHLPDKVSQRIKDEWFEEDETIRVADTFTVDLLFKCAGGKYRYEDLLPFCEEKELDGIKIKTLNAQGLWHTKQTGRDKDIPDLLFLQALLKMQGISVKNDLQTYSFEAIKNKIKNSFFK